MNGTDVQDTVKEMWETRPARPREDRQVAGVASAIARRYDIDPVLVRVGFVVTAFSGIGAALYIAGWFLLPEEPADPGAPARARSPRGLLVLGLAVAAAITLGSVFGNGSDIVLPTLAVAALLFLLHRSRSGRGLGAAPAGTATGAPDPTDAPTTAMGGVSFAKTDPSAAGPSMVKEPSAAAPGTPPAWDPLGAAPFAWDLPEPSSPPPAPPRRKAPVTLVTLGVALLAAGGTAVVMLLGGMLTLANAPVLFGVTLAVIGIGLVAGAFLRSGHGLIPIALVLGVLTWGMIAAPLDRWQVYGVGELRATPATVADLQPVYERAAGDVDLDLRNLDLTVAPGGDTSPVRTSVSLGAGDVQVWVPRDADVSLTSDIGIGDVTFDNREQSGFGSTLDVTDDLGADGVRSGRPLVIDIEAGLGEVEVHRG